MTKRMESRVSPRQLVGLVCAAQVLVQLGAFFWPALLPGLVARWELTYGEAGLDQTARCSMPLTF